MCRYALHSVKTHFACLDCEHTAKYPAGTDPRCPSCREPLTDLGRDFKAPRRSARSQWEKIRLLVDAGITFDSCGCGGPGWRPSTLAETKTMLKRRRTHRKHGVRFTRYGSNPKWCVAGRELLDA